MVWKRSVAGLIFLVLVPVVGRGQLPQGPGLLLPVQDRTGSPSVAEIFAERMRSNLQGRGEVLDAEQLRVFLRHLRIRDLDRAAPRELEQLAHELGVDWLLAPILHEASDRGMPRLALSASVYRRGSRNLGWVDFAAASGSEGLPWLGLGGIDSVTELAERVSQRVAGRLLSGPDKGLGPGATPSASATAFRGKVAVIPFNAVTDSDSSGAAETVTRAALAALQRRGVTLVFPGLVEEVQRRMGRVWRGEVDDATGTALREQTGADWIFTGTVETFERGHGSQPEPRVAFAARLLETADNEIVWIGGSDRSGWDRQRLFGAGRVYSSGELLEEIMRVLVEEAEESAVNRNEGRS
ncbi:MAG: hypothetical protein GY769_25535 [bacterium]|nr:hypothetical protein [bacterium]